MCERALLHHPPTHPADPAYMANLCRDHGITILEVVPSLATQYVRDLAPLGQAGQMRIRRFLTGGEALSVALANSVYDALPNCEMVWNTYGPTEVTVQVRRCWAGWRGLGGAAWLRAAGLCDLLLLPSPSTMAALRAAGHRQPGSSLAHPFTSPAPPNCILPLQVITGAIPRGADRVPLGRPDHNVHCYISTYPGEDGEPEGEKFVPRVRGVGSQGGCVAGVPQQCM